MYASPAEPPKAEQPKTDACCAKLTAITHTV
jgi:hypothetical protein